MQKTKRQRKTVTTTSNSVKMAVNGTTIRIETPKSDRKPTHKNSTAKIIVEDINPFEGFAGFLREYAVVGLSIGFIIGNQMSSLVKIIVASLIVPLTQLFFGQKLDTRTFMLQFHNHAATFNWGLVIDGIMQLILLLVLVYVAFRFFSLDKLKKPDAAKQ